MGQKKLIRFAEIETFPNVLQYPEDISGNWKSFFKNDNPITIELACGKGEYTIGLAAMYPQRNFIGVDLKGNRIWVGAKNARAENLTNAAFLRIQIQGITDFFAEQEVSEVWITFPDPQLRISRSKKRLTHPKFLRLYKTILKENGTINVKTDSPHLYHFTKKVIDMYGCTIHEDLDNVYAEENIKDELKIQTHYESLDIAQSKKVHYLSFTLPDNLPGKELDAELHNLLKEDAAV
ncbi:MAG: tRNA (guanosine(46)-N7)-methyltransferase TrmB [Chitinophagaceae bacterium]